MLLYDIKVTKYNLPLEVCSTGNVVVFGPKKNNYYYETILSVNTPIYLYICIYSTIAYLFIDGHPHIIIHVLLKALLPVCMKYTARDES